MTEREEIEAAISAADRIESKQPRITELLRIANIIPKTGELLDLRRRVWKFALGLSEESCRGLNPVEVVAKELPKASDVTFYQRFTLLGIARGLPDEMAFRDLYREAIQLAINAASVIEEPYPRLYALFSIAKDLTDNENATDLYKEVMTDTFKTATAIRDPFAKQGALIDVFRELPKSRDYFPLLEEVIDESLAFFTVRKWMEDIEVVDVVDRLLSVEQRGIKESKKKRFLREKYAHNLSAELEKFGNQLNDIRFIDTLRPYNHVWVQPKKLRESIKKVVDHLNSLVDKYHGREIERPIFVSELHRGKWDSHTVRISAGPHIVDCISIDLGATNTVVMRKKGDSPPEFVPLEDISKKYDSTYIIPTVLGSVTNEIGATVIEENPIVNIKQMLFDGSSKGKEHMERFLGILYKHLKRNIVTGGWFSLISRDMADKLYVTVPVGFRDYRNTIIKISQKIFKGMKVEFIEEPLAAAIGYEVADERDKVIVVIDFGGSTLNVMVVRVNLKEVHVIAKPDRAQMVGGHDIDIWLSEYLAAKVGISNIPYSLISKAEEIKIKLSLTKEVPFEWGRREICRVSREEFEDILDRHDFYRSVDRAVSYVIRKAEKVGLSKSRIEAVLLTGGSSQIPSFKEKISSLFPHLRGWNSIYDHSPLSAVGRGAALYGTKDVTDRHLGMAYAVRYATNDKESPYSYNIILEKGDSLPIDKTFLLKPARKLGIQTEISLELFEVPESLIARRWVTESGMEFIKQELALTKDVTLNSIKSVTLPLKADQNDAHVTFHVNETGQLSIDLGAEGTPHETGIRLQ